MLKNISKIAIVALMMVVVMIGIAILQTMSMMSVQSAAAQKTVPQAPICW